jgi:hypothetical protein
MGKESEKQSLGAVEVRTSAKDTRQRSERQLNQRTMARSPGTERENMTDQE